MIYGQGGRLFDSADDLSTPLDGWSLAMSLGDIKSRFGVAVFWTNVAVRFGQLSVCFHALVHSKRRSIDINANFCHTRWLTMIPVLMHPLCLQDLSACHL